MTLNSDSRLDARPTTWILVAHRAGARLYENPRPGKGLLLIAEHEHQEGRLHERDLLSDRPGRSFDSRGSGRHAMEPRESAKESVAEGFARRLADELGRARKAGRFDQLALVAEPHFLGLLKGALDDKTKARLVATVPRDLAECPDEELASHLASLLEDSVRIFPPGKAAAAPVT